MDIISYNNKWVEPMKKHDKKYARRVDTIVEPISVLTSTFNAHDKVFLDNNDAGLFKTMGKINRQVDKNDGGVIEQGVYIGAPSLFFGGTKPGYRPLPGTDTASHMYSGNATMDLVDGLSMGGKILKVPRTDFHDPNFKHKKGGSFIKTFGRTLESGARNVMDFHNYMLSLGLDIGEQAAGPLGGIAGAAAATAMGQPELVPVGAVLGSAAAHQIAKRGRRGIKYYTGLGKMTAGSNGIVLDEKDIAKAIKSLEKYVNGLKKSKPSLKHLQILKDAGLIQDGGNIFNDIGKVAKKQGQKLIDHEKDQYNMVKTNMKEKVIPMALGVPEFYRGVFTGHPKEALRKQRAIAKGGGKTKNNTWVDHVRNYAKTHNLTYKQALSQSKASYKK